MLNSAKEFLINNIHKEDKIGVACSGGSDSVALLHFVVVSKIIPLENIFAVNVNHKIRGEESESDTMFVEKLSKELGIKFVGIEKNVPKIAKESGKGVEQVARDVRYDFFSSLIKQEKLKFVLTAHHREDNIESILLNIFRGCGIDGLKGTKSIRNDGMLRPFLGVSKQEIMDYLQKNKLKYVEDLSNLDIYHTRNFLRHEVLPKILDRFPNATTAIENLSREASDVSDHMKSVLDTTLIRKEDELIILDTKALTNAMLGARYVRECLQLANMRQNMTRKHIQLILDLKTKGKGKQLDLPNGIVRKGRGFLEFEKTRNEK